VTIVRTDVSEENIASIFRIESVSQLGTLLAIIIWLIVTANFVSDLLILSTLMMGAILSSETLVLKGPQGDTSQKRAFFIYFPFKLHIQ
jgi:hypothetical protein